MSVSLVVEEFKEKGQKKDFPKGCQESRQSFFALGKKKGAYRVPFPQFGKGKDTEREFSEKKKLNQPT